MPQSSQPSLVQFLVVEDHQNGQRIDNFLFSRLKGVPKSRLYRALRSGEIRVNAKRVKAEYRLCENDRIRIPPLRVAEPATPRAPMQKQLDLIEKSILYEDKGLLIINKPAGIAVHGGSGVAHGVIELLRNLRSELKFLELVHRLDRETTGCLMLAKKPGILKELHSLFVAGKIEKVYLALVKGRWHTGERTVRAALHKHHMPSGERIVKVHQSGKESATKFQALRQFKDTTLLEVKPLTGRTHQIRVHAAHINYPILGDDKYGDHELNRALAKKGIDRLFLHAASLKFEIPSTGQQIAICACLDTAFLKMLALEKMDEPLARG